MKIDTHLQERRSLLAVICCMIMLLKICSLIAVCFMHHEYQITMMHESHEPGSH